jgi:hypothetical protein
VAVLKLELTLDMLALMLMLMLMLKPMLVLMVWWFGSGQRRPGYWTPSLIHPDPRWFGADRRLS